MQVVLETPLVKVMQSLLYQTNTTILNLENVMVIIDPGWIPEEVYELQHEVERNSHKPLVLAFTHADYDHIAGSGAFPKVKNMMSVQMAEHLDPDEVLAKVKKQDDEFYFSRSYEVLYPTPDIVIRQSGAPFFVEKNMFIGLLIPGHTAEDLAVYCREADTLIIGDYLSLLEFPFVEYDYKAYISSLAILEEFISSNKPKYIIPGHGPAFKDYYQALLRVHIDLDYLKKLKDGTSDWEDWCSSYTFARSLKAMHERNGLTIKK